MNQFRPRVTRIVAVLALIIAPAVMADVVTVAVFDGAQPFIFVDSNGKPDGAYPELMERLLRDLGHTPRFVVYESFREALASVGNGETDLFAGAIISPEREQYLDFNVLPLYVTWSQVFVSPGARIENILDLRNHRVGIMASDQKGASFVLLMRSFDIPFIPVYYPSHADSVEALLDGELDAIVSFSQLYLEEPRIRPTGIVFAPSSGHIATADGHNHDLLSQIDRRIGELKDDEGSYYYDVLEKWFLVETRAEFPRWLTYLLISLAGAAVILTLFVIYLRRNQRMLHALNRDLSEAQQKLVRRERLAVVGELTAAVGNELRNPLGTLENAIHTIETEVAESRSERAKSAIELARRSLRRCEYSVEAFTDFAERRTLQARRVGLSDWLSDVVRKLHVPKEIVLTQHVSSGATASIDPRYFEKVIRHLIANAVDALTRLDLSEPRIRIDAREYPGGAKITVSGPGKWFSPTDLGPDCEPVCDGRKPGLWLGLCLSREVVHDHGGAMELTVNETESAMNVILPFA